MKKHIYLLVLPLLLMGSCKELSDPEYRRLKSNIQTTVNWNYNWSGNYVNLDASVVNANTQPVSNVSVQLSFYNYRNELITTRYYTYRRTMAPREQIYFSATYNIDSVTRIRQKISNFSY